MGTLSKINEMKDFDNIYFVGAGGTRNGRTGALFPFTREKSSGYDRTPSPLTGELASEGVGISFDDSQDAIPQKFRDPLSTLVVRTPAVPDENIPLNFFRNGGFTIMKRSEVLGAVTRDSLALCFAGGHTAKPPPRPWPRISFTTAAPGCNAFLGGILGGTYNSNLILSADSPYSVIEADEYDRSFHTLTPHIAVINATDPDHLDIYGTEEAYLESFAHFTELIRPGGSLVLRQGMKLIPRPTEGVAVYTFGRDSGDFHAAHIRRTPGRIVFRFHTSRRNDKRHRAWSACRHQHRQRDLGFVGMLAHRTPHASEIARNAMASYPGVERRFQFHLKQDSPDGKVVIDDYAHHPDELSRSIESVARFIRTDT